MTSVLTSQSHSTGIEMELIYSLVGYRGGESPDLFPKMTPYGGSLGTEWCTQAQPPLFSDITGLSQLVS